MTDTIAPVPENTDSTTPVNPNRKVFTWDEFSDQMPIPLDVLIGIVAGIASAEMSDEESEATSKMLGNKPPILMRIGHEGHNPIELVVEG